MAVRVRITVPATGGGESMRGEATGGGESMGGGELHGDNEEKW